jgi:DNA-directed RNA polymerase subunit RPC12/RpoP
MFAFIKKVENFRCQNCGGDVVGTGYTNHCSNCLWSKHVDIDPGDRGADCKGLMKPVALEKKGEVFMIVHQCEKCGFKRLNKALKGDNFEELVRISISKDD